jgi:L-fuculose-phosphate aldolase
MIEEELAEYAHRLHARGWVANHDGNISVRQGAQFLCTPTATSKAAVTAGGLVLVDDRGNKAGGAGKPFSEIGLHLTVYQNRPDVNAVVHAHPPAATGFAVAGVTLDTPFIAEAVVSLGPSIPTVPFAAPGADACAALTPYTQDCDAVLIANHGVFAWGPDLETAYLRLELVEHLAKIAVVARQLGGVRALPSEVLPSLFAAREKAGLGASARKKVVVACAPAPPGSDVTVYEAPRARAQVLPSSDAIAALIREEIVAALKK